MFRPASIFIGLRYTRAKRRNHFISFISGVSMVGIALSITVLITVLSVMNGFDQEIRKRVFSVVPPITVASVTGYVSEWQSLQKMLTRFPYVIASAPYATGQLLLSNGSDVQPAIVQGILPDEEKNISEIAEKMEHGKLSDLAPGEFGIILGESLATRLGAEINDKVTLVTPAITLTPAGLIPRLKRFTVVGIFKAGNGFGFDSSLGFIHLKDAQALLGLGRNVTGLHLAIKNVYQAPQIAQQLRQQLNSSADITTWADQFGEFFHAVQLEKTMMFLILLLMLALAAFNLVSTLVMAVNEKESDIAILRTFGATPGTIMKIFIIQGGFVGLIGTVAGIIGGVILALNVTPIMSWIEHTFNLHLLSSSVYFVNYLPSKIEWLDIVKIAIASLLLSLLATIYPALRASKMDPVESLRYE